jgi:hypothetical protein
VARTTTFTCEQCDGEIDGFIVTINIARVARGVRTPGRDVDVCEDCWGVMRDAANRRRDEVSAARGSAAFE